MAEDRFANRAGITVTESAAGTLTFQELITGVGFNTKKGMLIDEIDYYIPQATVALLVANPDEVRFGITSSTGVTDLEDATDSRILHSASFQRRESTAVGVEHLKFPLVYQFFPSLIHAHIRIHLAILGVSLATVANVRVRILWRFIDLNDREIAELVQATLLQG